MERAWILDGQSIAENIKNASVSSSLQIQEFKAFIDCPKCSYRIDNTNVATPWPGLPKGVKFEPTDEEVIEHLEAKCGINGLKPHSLIQDYICSLNENKGINYTHPQKFPGVRKDGVSVFYFNKISDEYNPNKKKRKITNSTDETLRWYSISKHQAKPVMVNGIRKGSKQTLKLYNKTRKVVNPDDNSSWVLDLYHLGTKEGEIGEFVVSKITYQKQKQMEKKIDESESFKVQGSSSQLVHEDEDKLENTQEPSSDPTSDKIAIVEGNSSVNEDNLMPKEIEASSFLVETENPNNGKFDFETDHFDASELEDVNLETLLDSNNIDTTDSLLDEISCVVEKENPEKKR